MNDQPIPNEPDIDDAPHPADTTPATVGRLLPHDLNAEAALLGAMMLSPVAVDAAATVVGGPDDFYKPAHGHIYAAIVAAATEGPVDAVTVADQLGPLLPAVGGAGVLVALIAECPAISNAGRYASIVARHARDRRFIHGLTEALDAARDGQIDTALGLAEATVDTRAAAGARSTLVRVGDDLERWLNELEQRHLGDGTPGVLTGWNDLDHRLGGLRAGQLVVVAGRPGMGKTAVAGCLAVNASTDGHPVLVVSIEMAVDELETRFVARTARTSSLRLRDGTVSDKDWPHIARGIGELADLQLWVNDDPTVTVPVIRAHARRIGARLVIVDYIQLMQGNTGRRNDTREREVAELSGALKRLARELECPVVALAQLNRNLEMRVEKRPLLSDLRESGAIENDADVVLMLYRDEYYNHDSKDRGILEIITAKQRAGATGTDRLAYIADLSMVTNLAEGA